MKSRFVFSVTLSICLSALSLSAQTTDPTLIAHFPMDLTGNTITETVSGQTFTVANHFNKPESVPGADGNCLRTDGYSTYCNASINASALNSQALSVNLWCALETYPVMDPNNNVTIDTYIAGNLRDDLQTGFAFVVNANGRYGFVVYINGSRIACYAPTVFPTYQWEYLSATVNTQTKYVYLYINGILSAESSFPGSIINTGNNAFMIGKSFNDLYTGPFLTSTINGLIDDIQIYSRVLTASQLGYHTPNNVADLSIPTSRFSGDIQRPIFHGIPAANWTNEPTGLIYYNGQYHLFFQKNANGPYWGKLHWGHLVSNDLISWKEDKIALAPGSSYDIKGTWSGCVYMDNGLTGAQPNIFYTSVDYSKASISRAIPLDDSLITWEKDPLNPLIPNCPSGLSGDFRDPHIFTSNGIYYMVVGTSKNNVGAATLQQYNPTNNTWSNDGRIFYQATSANYGTFWEMPIIEPMPNGKWIFLVTTIGGTQGVTTLYWVGTINSDGTFNPYSSTPKQVELGAFGSNGYGLLSPSILHQNGKTIAIGIVPDNLPSQNNYNLGWAHLFSLPREWSLDTNNNLIQLPYSGLEKIREVSPDSSFHATNLVVNGTSSLSPVNGNTVEIEATFSVSTAQQFGFNVRKDGTNEISIYYTPATNMFTVNAQNSSRLVNDASTFNGLYTSSFPNVLSVGDLLKMHIYIDHSIMDIFLNDQYAFSIRVFPIDPNANQIEVFSNGGATTINSIDAWNLSLNASQGASTAASVIPNDQVKLYVNGDQLIYSNVPQQSMISIFDVTGRLLQSAITENTSGEVSLSQIQNHTLYIVRIVGNAFFYTKKIFMG